MIRKQAKVIRKKVTPQQLPAAVARLFSRFNHVFREYPNLYLKGGGARDTLAYLLGRASDVSFRDIDLVLISRDWEEKESLKTSIAESMGLDEEDVEVIGTLSYYFQSRDVGINEVLIRPDEILFTEKARRDFENNVVSPTNYEYDRESGELRPRFALRALLLGARKGMDVKMKRVLHRALEDAGPFDILVHLFKAFEEGVEDSFFKEINHLPMLRNTPFPEEGLVKLMGLLNYPFRMNAKQQRIYDDVLKITKI